MAEAIRMPAVEGNQGTLAGTLRRPGDGASSCRVSAAGSGLYTTFRCRMPRSRSSRRMTRARGQTEVLEMSVICKRPGSSLLPVPRAEIMGMPRCPAWAIRSSLQVTRSMQSAI